MSITRCTAIELSNKSLCAYFDSLIGRFFKILPMRENKEASLDVYIRSLQCELVGCEGIEPPLQECTSYTTLLSILQFFIDTPDCEITEVKREVFRAIDLCSKLKKHYSDKGAQL